MNLNPLVVGYRQFNILLLVLSIGIVVLAIRKLSASIDVAPILILVFGLVAAIITLQHLRTRRGVVLLGCTRRYFVKVQTAFLTAKVLGTVYRPGRGIGFIRELFAHHRNPDVNDNQLINDLRNYIAEHSQSINPREMLLLSAWMLALAIVAGIVAWLLLG